MSDPYMHEFPGDEEHKDRPTWRDRVRHAPRAVMIASLVAALAVGGAGVAFAAGSGSSSSSSTPSSTSPTTTPKANGPHGPMGRPGFGPFRGLDGLGLGGLAGGGVLHGTVTIRSGSGYKTLDIRTGTVTQVSSTSITVQSSDQTSETYGVTSSTIVNSQAAGIGSVTKGDQVSVVATVSGSTATATNIVDTTKIKSSWKSFGFGQPPGNGSSSSNAPAGTAGVPGPGFGRGGPGPSQPL
jgi:hypothetical protein